MIVKIPNQLEIGGFTFKIDYTHCWEIRGDNAYGKCKPVIQEIWIDDDVSPERLTETFYMRLYIQSPMFVV